MHDVLVHASMHAYVLFRAGVHVHVDVLVHASMHAYVLFRAGVHERAVRTERLEKGFTLPRARKAIIVSAFWDARTASPCPRTRICICCYRFVIVLAITKTGFS